MYPATPPASDLSRRRLRQIAHWIREELDPIIARDGPETLRADDVLTLHDVFQALRTSTTTTALDLRATGIHKAIMDVSGIATRWPGRLIDDCDKIITIWTERFGRLENLHPFLYGRGGRLEGIATADEYSNQALLKRWQITCPEKIMPKRSHRSGNLGFHAGAWWINSLFACHAGIIDVDTIEGGICSDKNGAYALLLKDTGEIEALTETMFTYRCGRNDKGKFRLTAATPNSRNPIRVLRSHSINSMWGPKAGIRYEGLYRVVGWAIHQKKGSDTSDIEFRPCNIIYDIKFERDDPVPMEEVVKVPTACEVDDYSEYKRLRKVHRDLHRKGIAAHVLLPGLEPAPVKVAPPIPPAPLMVKSALKVSPSASRSATIKQPPSVDEELLTPSRSASQNVRAGGVPDMLFDNEDLSYSLSNNTLRLPARTTLRPTTQYRRPDLPPDDTHFHPPKLEGEVSNPSSEGTKQSHQSDIREVAPWTDYDLQLVVPTSHSPPPIAQRETIVRPSKEGWNGKDHEEHSPRTGRSSKRNSLSPKPKEDQRKKSTGPRHKLFLAPTSRGQDLKKESRKSIFVRSKNPMAKLFDGAEDTDDGEDYFNCKRTRSRAASASPRRTSPHAQRRKRASSSHDTPLSPIPLRPMSPFSPLLQGRRDAISIPYSFFTAATPIAPELVVPAAPRDSSIQETFKEASPARSIHSLPVSLKQFISRPRPVTALSTPASSPSPVRNGGQGTKPLSPLAAERLRKFIEGVQERESQVVFKDPFLDDEVSPLQRRASSGNVAPDVVA